MSRESWETGWRPFDPCREHEIAAAVEKYPWLGYALSNALSLGLGFFSALRVHAALYDRATEAMAYVTHGHAK